jgi:MFS family permease
MKDRSAFRFVLLMSVVSLFGDMTYEGARSVLGPFFATLGASGAVVGTVSGAGEFIGFTLRYFSGLLSDRSRRYWTIAIAGYTINLLSVPALAFARTWPVASALVIGERFGRGVRKPATNAMISYAGSQLGQGWVFGFRELMDQTGATIGPLIISALLFAGAGFSRAFAWLAVPAILSLAFVVYARISFPVPSNFERPKKDGGHERPRRLEFWLYVAGTSMLAAGYADYSLIAYHFSKAHVYSNDVIPIIYAGAMLSSALASPLLGKLYDRYRGGLIVAVLFAVAAYAPLSFLGTSWIAIAGIVLWGVGMAAQDALFPAIVAHITPHETRATALGLFDAVYGVAWFLGSVLMGVLYDRGVMVLVVVSLVFQVLIGLPLVALAARSGTQASPPP